MMLSDEDEKALMRAQAILSKRFDSGQILITKPSDDGGTIMRMAGFGNWYARIGLARAFLLTEDEYAKREINRE